MVICVLLLPHILLSVHSWVLLLSVNWANSVIFRKTNVGPSRHPLLHLFWSSFNLEKILMFQTLSAFFFFFKLQFCTSVLAISNNLAILGYVCNEGQIRRWSINVIWITVGHIYSNVSLLKWNCWSNFFPDSVEIQPGYTTVYLTQTENRRGLEEHHCGWWFGRAGECFRMGEQPIFSSSHWCYFQTLFKTSLNLVAQSILHFHLKWLIMVIWYLKHIHLNYF